MATSSKTFLDDPNKLLQMILAAESTRGGGGAELVAEVVLVLAEAEAFREGQDPRTGGAGVRLAAASGLTAVTGTGPGGNLWETGSGSGPGRRKRKYRNRSWSGRWRWRTGGGSGTGGWGHRAAVREVAVREVADWDRRFRKLAAEAAALAREVGQDRWGSVWWRRQSANGCSSWTFCRHRCLHGAPSAGGGPGIGGTGGSGGQYAVAEDDVRSMLTLFAQLGQIAARFRFEDGRANIPIAASALPVRAQFTLQQALAGLAAQAPNESPDKPMLLKLAEHVAIRFALDSYERGELRVNAVKQLLDRMNTEMKRCEKSWANSRSRWRRLEYRCRTIRSCSIKSSGRRFRREQERSAVFG